LWSMAIADLMSRGKPVICFDSGAMPEIISDHDLLFSSQEEFNHIVKELLMNRSFYLEKSKSVAERTRVLSLNHIANEFDVLFARELKNAQ
jgi:glycosyltransferase involved in cell wall biosynthesis